MNGLEKLCSMVTNRLGKTRKQKSNDGNRFVVYYRVSTKMQGDSGLGLEAQRSAAEAYVKQRGGEIIGKYQEVETGKDCKQPSVCPLSSLGYLIFTLVTPKHRHSIMKNPNNDRLLRIDEVCQHLSLSPSSVRRLRAAGKLPACKTGKNSVRWKQSIIQAYINSLRDD